MTDIIFSDRLETLKLDRIVYYRSLTKVDYINGLIIICLMNTLQL